LLNDVIYKNKRKTDMTTNYLLAEFVIQNWSIWTRTGHNSARVNTSKSLSCFSCGPIAIRNAEKNPKETLRTWLKPVLTVVSMNFGDCCFYLITLVTQKPKKRMTLLP